MSFNFGIQGKFLSILLSAILVAILSIAAVIYISVNANSLQKFKNESHSQLETVDTYISAYIDSVKNNALLLSKNPHAKKGLGKHSSPYLDANSKKVKRMSEVDGTEKQFMQVLQRMVGIHPSYSMAYIGYKDGAMSVMPETPMPAGYDPRQRPWYQEAMESSQETYLSSAYLSTTGNPCTTVVSKVHSPQGSTVGAIGIDLKLSTLTDVTSAIELGQTGYVMLMEDGVILSDPANKEHLFKEATEVDDAAYAKIENTNQGTFEAKMGGTEKLVTVSVSEGTGWKLAAVIDKQEVYQAGQSMVTKIMLIGLGLALVFGAIGFFLSRKVTKPIKGIVSSLTRGSEQTSSAANQVSSTSQSLAEGSSEQASSLEETSSSLEEMSSQIKHTADSAGQAEQTVSQGREEVEGGVQVMQQMSQAIQEIKSSSEETSKIIKTIDDIAFQTNLLALNAAVEAARAGEAGKGFAVVAEEVRNLAQRSSEAAKNTSDLIEKSQSSAENGVKVVDDVSQRLSRIQESVQQVDTLVKEIAGASKEQAQGIEQVNSAVSEMDKVVQQNASDSEETASAAEELSSQAREQDKMVRMLMGIVEGAKASSTSFQAQGSTTGDDGSGRSSSKSTGSSSGRGRREASQHQTQSRNRGEGHRASGQGSTGKSSGDQSQTRSNADRMIPLDDSDSLKDF